MGPDHRWKVVRVVYVLSWRPGRCKRTSVRRVQNLFALFAVYLFPSTIIDVNAAQKTSVANPQVQLITSNRIAHQFYLKLGYEVYDRLEFSGVKVFRMQKILRESVGEPAAAAAAAKRRTKQRQAASAAEVN